MQHYYYRFLLLKQLTYFLAKPINVKKCLLYFQLLVLNPGESRILLLAINSKQLFKLFS